jgi:hypothetical protein
MVVASEPGVIDVRCKSCRYPLAKLPEHRCPECGRGFDPNDPWSFENDGRWRDWPYFALLAGLIMIAAMLTGLAVPSLMSPTSMPVVLLPLFLLGIIMVLLGVVVVLWRLMFPSPR